MSSRFVHAVAIAAICAASTFAAPGLTVFHIGNSLTDETYGMHDVAQGFGRTWTQYVYGRSMIPGSPIHLLWSENVKKTADKNDGNCGFFLECRALGSGEVWIDQTYAALWSTSLYLRANSYDAVVLQIFNSNGDSYRNQWGPGLNSGTIDGVVGYAREAYAGNPNCQVYLYASHTMDYNTIDNSMTNTYIDYVALKDTINHAFPSRKPALIIPAPLAFNAMVQAGYNNLWVSATDGHANANGKYLLSCLFCAIIYKSNPAGATTNGHTGVTASYVNKIHEVAWNIATTYAHSGVGNTAVTNGTSGAAKAAVTSKPLTARAFNLAGQDISTSPQNVTRKTVTPAVIR